MYLPFVTSSGADRFLACTGSAALPKVHDERSIHAAAGVDEHAVKLQPGRLPKKVLDWFGAEPAYEVAMAADCEGIEARYLGQYIERGYPLMPGPRWLAGTADMIRVDGDVVSVGDLKTGRGQARGSLPSPAKSGQLLSLAWMAIAIKQAQDPTFHPARIRLMWWLTADAPDDIDDAEISYDDLMQWVAEFRRKVVMSQTHGALQLHRGPHCGGCGAFDACPAQGGAVRRIAELSGRIADSGVMSDADVAAAFQDLQAAKRIVETASEALRLRVEARGEVDVDAGHKLKLVRGTDSKIDAVVAASVLGDKFLDCATVTVSQAGIKRGLDTHDIGGIVEEIRQRGGVVTVPKASYLRVVKK